MPRWSATRWRDVLEAKCRARERKLQLARERAFGGGSGGDPTPSVANFSLLSYPTWATNTTTTASTPTTYYPGTWSWQDTTNSSSWTATYTLTPTDSLRDLSSWVARFRSLYLTSSAVYGQADYARFPVTWETSQTVPVGNGAAKRLREHAAAIKRGRKLLMSLMDEHQLHDWGASGMFRVEASDGRMFVVRKNHTVVELDEHGIAIASHCIHLPQGYIPEDTMIGLKLMLENDVEAFEETANKTVYAEPTPLVAIAARMPSAQEAATMLAA